MSGLFGLVLAGLGCAGSQFPIHSPQIALFVAALGFGGIAVVGQAARSYLNYWQGHRGEQAAKLALQPLPDDYTLIANWTDGSPQGDVDLLVVGPHGVLVVEVKNWLGELVCEDDKWYRVMENGYKKPTKSPTKQALSNARWVEGTLRSAKVACQVKPLVVFNGGAEIKGDSRRVPIVRTDTLLACVRALPIDRNNDRERTAGVLLEKGARPLEPRRP